MKYKDMRPHLRSGDLLLCSGNAIFSKLIQRATKSPWSHVGFILKIESIDRLMVLESVESIGVRAVPLSSYFNNYNGSEKSYNGKIHIKRHKDYTSRMTHELSIKAVDLLGKRYDWPQIFRIAKRIFFNKENNNPIVDDGIYICSEYAYECYKSVCIVVKHNSGGFISPADFGMCEDFYSLF